MMCVLFYGSLYTTIVSCNSSTKDIDETDIITFDKELSSLVRLISKHNVLIGGDMNAYICKDANNKSAGTTLETEMENIEQISHSRTVSHA